MNVDLEKRFSKLFTAIFTGVCLLTAVLVFWGPGTVKVYAEEGASIGANLTWKIDGGTLTISGRGEMNDYNWDADWGDSPFFNNDEITSLVVEDGVTGIGDNIVAYCGNLRSVILADSVTRIGAGAFGQCSSLTEISIPDHVTRIGNLAFSSSGLKKILIPSGVTDLGENVVSYCNDLTSIVVDGENSVYDSRNNCNAIIESATNTLITACDSTRIPESVTTIGARAFAGRNMTEMVIPEGVTSIGDRAFGNCMNLLSITMPDSVTDIGFGAFSYCESLRNVTIPAGVTNLGGRRGSVFHGCKGLESVTILGSIRELGMYSFEYCNSLKEITLPNTLRNIGLQAFNGCTSLAEVHFSGSESVWKSVTIGEYNECLTNAAFTFVTCMEHSWNEGKVIEKATCDESGETLYTCTICGEMNYETIPKTNEHKWEKLSVPATCEDAGYEVEKCSTCRREKNRVEYEKLPHNYGAWSITKEATSFSEGVKTRTCKECGYKETEIIGKLPQKISASGQKLQEGAAVKELINNPLKVKVKGKKYKASALKKSKKTFLIGVSNAKGKVTYTLDKKAKKAKIKVSKKGKVTIPKKCKKGSYKITVSAAGDKNYKAGKKTVKIVIK